MKKYLPYIAAAGALYLLLHKKSSTAPGGAQSVNTIAGFVEKISAPAASVYNAYGIRPVITTSQAALESNYGTSGLTRQANNLFGIKAGSTWTGNIYTAETKEYILGIPYTTHADFRRYSSWLESCTDWARLLVMYGRYEESLRAAQEGDIEKFAYEIAKSGYATDPNYKNALLTKYRAVKEYL